MKKFGIYSRGTGKINDKGVIEDYKLISYDYATLYPNTMKDFTKDAKLMAELKRLERRRKLDEIEKNSKDENG